MSERTDAEIKKAVCEAAGEPRGEVRARALEAMAGVAPARGWSRRRVVAATVAVAAAMVGLGIVSLPVGKQGQEWNRVLAAVNSASSIHVRARLMAPAGEEILESWSANGFRRSERWENGNLVRLHINRDIPSRRYLSYEVRNGKKYGIDRARPPRPRMNWAAVGAVGAGGDELRAMLARLAGSGNVRTRRVTRADKYGQAEVIEADITAEREWGWSLSGSLHMGDRFRVRAEVDPKTGRVLSLAEYTREGEHWKQTYVTECIEYDVPITDDLKSFIFPKGTAVAYSRWWDGRTDKVIAEEKVDGWTVKLHALDVDRAGDIYLTYSLWSDKKRDASGWTAAEAIDIAQRRYGRFIGGTVYNDYGLIVMRPHVDLVPRKQGRAARTVTITFWPRSGEYGQRGGKPVVFRHLPLPPRTDVVYAKEITH